MVRELAAREHLGPDGRWVTVSRATLDRWVRCCRAGGFQALLPARRRVQNKTSERISGLALRREQSARTAAQIRRIILEAEGAAPSERTIQRHLLAAGLFWKGQVTSRALGRFEACAPNELWTGDALHRPLIEGKRAIPFCCIDDHSRLLTGYRWGLREDVMSASQALQSSFTRSHRAVISLRVIGPEARRASTVLRRRRLSTTRLPFNRRSSLPSRQLGRPDS